MIWKAVFWDFDGVVLDSVDIKTKAFASMFRKYGPEIEKAVVEYHLSNGGVSRYDKFKYFYHHLLNCSISDETLKKLGEEFSSIVFQKVLAAPFIPGAMETLTRLKMMGVPSYIVSGTPQEEVRHIVTLRNLKDFFDEVHGSPRGKKEIINDILERFKFDPEKCVFLGDAMTDFDAAQKTGVSFIGIIGNGGKVSFPNGTLIMNSVNI